MHTKMGREREKEIEFVRKRWRDKIDSLFSYCVSEKFSFSIGRKKKSSEHNMFLNWY